MLLSRGNSKLGQGVFCFNIPAKQTCPGSTPACRSACYAAAGRFRTGTVKSKVRANLEFARRPDFDRLVSAEIVTHGVRLLRLHSAGDLFSADYARAWLRVMRAHPDVVFWLYTRSWRVAPIRRVVVRMAALDNVHVWFSADRDTKIPTRLPPRVRVAYLALDPDDRPATSVDLVFRARKARARVGRTSPCDDGVEAPVCPTETGLDGAHAVTCASCRKCFTEPAAAGRVALPVLWTTA